MTVEYRMPDEPYRVLPIVCTGSGRGGPPHRVERFGTFRVYASGTVDLRLRPRAERDGTVGIDYERLNRGRLWHTTLRCPQCGRNPRLQAATMRTAAVALARAGFDKIDLSQLPF